MGPNVGPRKGAVQKSPPASPRLTAGKVSAMTPPETAKGAAPKQPEKKRRMMRVQGF